MDKHDVRQFMRMSSVVADRSAALLNDLRYACSVNEGAEPGSPLAINLMDHLESTHGMMSRMNDRLKEILAEIMYDEHIRLDTWLEKRYNGGSEDG